MSRRDSSEQLVWRARLLAVCLALAAVAFRQQPGEIVGDTKADLTLSSWGFLRGALHLWDPQLYFGQLQNQAYGYLFPMGPFHGVLISLGVPAWITQRLWWTTLLVLAFLGTWQVAGELAAGSRWLRLTGALLYALSPRIVGELTTTSVEVWPMAIAPWVLLPLVVRQERTWRWRITRSALAVALCGGVNAVATGAVLVLPTLWFLTRRPSRSIPRAFLGWLGAVVLATAWWLIPLLILGANSPPFLDWIESAITTTRTASTFEALRGTSAWLGYLTTPIGPHWPGGWAYVSRPVLIFSTALVVAAGLAGLATRRLAERAFLAASLVLGLILVTLGHRGPFGPVWSDLAFRALDGPLAPLRNAHKFDLVVRLPLAVAAVAGLEAALDGLRRVGVQRWVQVTVASALVVAAASPALTARLARDEGYAAMPHYWHEAAAWLDRAPGHGSVLMLPATDFADFTWGSAKDNPLQAIMHRPFVLRDAVPLGSAGSTRFLDGVNRVVASGRGGPSVAEALATAGVGYLLVAADLRRDAQTDPLVAVEQGLATSGLTVAATFGPTIVDREESSTTTVDYRSRPARPAITVYAVPYPHGAAMVDVARTPTVLAGPEDTLELARIGIPWALLGTDPRAIIGGYAAADATVLTDGLRRREVFFGAAADAASPVLGPADGYTQDRPVHDVVADAGAPETTAGWRGVSAVLASSSAADAGASLRLGAAYGPAAAVDGDAGTRWVSGRFGSAVGEWLELRLTQPVRPGVVRLLTSHASPIAAAPHRILVTTAAGSRSMTLDGFGSGTVAAPDGPTDWIRFTLTATDYSAPNGLSIAEVTIGGVTPRLVLAPPAVRAPEVIDLRADDASRTGCWATAQGSVCSPPTIRPREPPPGLDRLLTLGTAGSYRLAGTVRPAPTSDADVLVRRPGVISATATSRLVPGLADRPDAAVDLDLATGWVASTQDPQPRFTLRLPQPRTVRGLQFFASSTRNASLPRRVRLDFGAGDVVSATTSADGTIRFRARRTDVVRLSFGATDPLVDIDSATRLRTFVPVGFGEVRVLGADDLRSGPDADALVDGTCGAGPGIVVNGTELATKLGGTVGDALAGRPLSWSVCSVDRVDLVAGVNEMTTRFAGSVVPDAITLRRTAPVANPPTDVPLERPGPANLRLRVPARDGEGLVTVPQNFHPGWTARLGDGRLVAGVRVNGWMQGWRVPAGQATTLTASFGPDTAYRLGLAAGGLALLALLGLGPGLTYAARLPALRSSRLVASRRWGSVELLRRPPLPVSRTGRVRRDASLAAAGVTATGVAIGGAFGAAVAVAVLAACWWRPRDAGLIRAAAGLGGLALATAIVGSRPWPGSGAAFDSAFVQAGAILVVVAAISQVMTDWLSGGRRLEPRPRPRRMTGRSMR